MQGMARRCKSIDDGHAAPGEATLRARSTAITTSGATVDLGLRHGVENADADHRAQDCRAQPARDDAPPGKPTPLKRGIQFQHPSRQKPLVKCITRTEACEPNDRKYDAPREHLVEPGLPVAPRRVVPDAAVCRHHRDRCVHPGILSARDGLNREGREARKDRTYRKVAR